MNLSDPHIEDYEDDFFEKIDIDSESLSGKNFQDCHFKNCRFSDCDFSRARGYNMHPGENKMKGAIFTYPDIVNLLSPLGIFINDK
ncbi:MAG: pentapeptide repeat-containing protein [Spirochaetaceae bacterium]|nr:pentapeptide repeat-containing protein [Spirochaetaceae bacterium]